ncbi:MAG: ABC-type Co2+ transport system permease component-like protein [uncultured bacterium]|nr:MAG: ABC-type Co2+ transport system permease component-like protein [uncultured bacterium]HBH17863.1 hypothetical protein [Cyanobacteria bacterium UBA9579]
MSHIHIPDGVLPFWLVMTGYLLIAIYFLFLAINKKKININKKIALVGVMSALMFITMTVEIIPPAYHMNLAVLSGIILGPVLSILAIFSANILLVLLGHGGISVIGLNAFVVSLEAIIGFWGFRFLNSRIKNIFISASLAAFIALFISAWASIGIVYLGTNDMEALTHNHEHKIETVQDSHNHEQPVHHDDMDFDAGRFIVAILSLGLLGWVIESMLTGFIIKYIKQIKPDIIEYKVNPHLNELSGE